METTQQLKREISSEPQCSDFKSVVSNWPWSVTSLGVQWLNLQAPQAGSRSLLLGQGTRSRLLQLRILPATRKVETLHAASKTLRSQTYIFFKRKKGKIGIGHGREIGPHYDLGLLPRVSCCTLSHTAPLPVGKGPMG